MLKYLLHANLCLHHSDVDDIDLVSGSSSQISPQILSPSHTSSQTSSRQSSVEPLKLPSSNRNKQLSHSFSAKRKRAEGNEDVDSLLIKSLQALDEPQKEDDEEDLFGRQVAVVLRRFTARQKAQAKLKI